MIEKERCLLNPKTSPERHKLARGIDSQFGSPLTISGHKLQTREVHLLPPTTTSPTTPMLNIRPEFDFSGLAKIVMRKIFALTEAKF